MFGWRPSVAGGARRPRRPGGDRRLSRTAWRRRCRSARWTGSARAAPPCSSRSPPASRAAAPCRWPTPGSAGCSTRWAGRWTATGRCRPAPRRAPVRAAAARGDAARPPGSAARSRRARAQLLRHLPPGPAARPVLRLRHRQVDACSPCWPATPHATWRCSPWSASAGARCASSWRTIWARRGWRARSSWSPPRTRRRCCAARRPTPR